MIVVLRETPVTDRKWRGYPLTTSILCTMIMLWTVVVSAVHTGGFRRVVGCGGSYDLTVEFTEGRIWRCYTKPRDQTSGTAEDIGRHNVYGAHTLTENEYYSNK